MREETLSPELNKAIANLLANTGTTSKSTDKLALLVGALDSLPPEKKNKIQSISLTWESIDHDVVVPNLEMEFFE